MIILVVANSSPPLELHLPIAYPDDWKSRSVEEILNLTAASRAAQSAGWAVGRVTPTPNMAFVLPREIIIYKQNGRTD